MTGKRTSCISHAATKFRTIGQHLSTTYPSPLNQLCPWPSISTHSIGTRGKKKNPRPPPGITVPPTPAHTHVLPVWGAFRAVHLPRAQLSTKVPTHHARPGYQGGKRVGQSKHASKLVLAAKRFPSLTVPAASCTVVPWRAARGAERKRRCSTETHAV